MQGGAGRAGDRRGRLALACLAAWAVAVAAAVLAWPTAAPAQVTTVQQGDLVVTQMQAGRVVAIAPSGEEREIATGLRSPRGVAVMADGSILVAETGANRVVGIGGRFGSDAPQEVVAVPFPEGISVSPDGGVYVTLLQAGEIGQIDVDAGTYTPIAEDLEGPGDVVARGIAIFVTQSAPDGRVVSRVAADGRTADFADGFTQPIGLAFGPGATLFVADFGTNQIVRVDAAGETSVFAAVQEPAHLAIEPYLPDEGQPFTLAVTSAEGVVRFDQTGARVGVTPLEGTAGISSVPGTGPGGTPGPSITTTLPTTVPTTSGTVPTSEGGPVGTAPATTRPPRTTTTISEAEGAPSSTSGAILMASLAIIGLIVVGAVVFVVVQRPKSGSRSGFEERPLDANTVALAFGACAAEEVEVAEAEGALASIETQVESAGKRLVAAEERVEDARRALDVARAEAPADREPTPPRAPAPGLRPDDLELTTAAGRAALDAFLRHEIEAHELEDMWRSLGEDRAIEVVRAGGPLTADGEPEPIDPVARAEADLAEAEEDVEHARTEIGRLRDREDAARERIAEAHAALEACQDRHRAELAAESEAATRAALAAAVARDDVPRPPAPSRPAGPNAVSLPGFGGPDEPSGPDADEEPPGDAAVPPTPTAPGSGGAAGAEVPGSDGGDEDGGDDGDGDDDDDGGPGGGSDPADPEPGARAERPPLVVDAATVAALSRPRPDATPTSPADADDDPGADDAATPPEPDPGPPARRDGLDRGLFGDEGDTPAESGSSSTFPDQEPNGPADTDPAAGPLRSTGVDPSGLGPMPAADDDREESLSELLSRHEPTPDQDPSAPRLDDLRIAWPAATPPTLRTTPAPGGSAGEEGPGAGSPPPAEAADEPDRDDRDELGFL